MEPLGLCAGDIESFLVSSGDLYVDYDRVIGGVIARYPGNSTFDELLVKAVVINQLYATRIRNIAAVAHGLMRLDVERRLQEGDTTLVHDIASIQTGSGNYNFSFATKYCCWHQPTRFVIFDSWVGWLLKALNRRHGFSAVALRDIRNRSYPHWHRMVDDFRTAAGATALDYKRIDKYLWIRAQSERA